ncbi:Malate/lactate/ureidoglycolate dehydrogenase, LDH2 family [Microvirga guangxiensis]|uniref:Malate/lactate/ureidoglycolate dehydrogenase, LDH2 family n=1 Tax=Microvirga guangxiensis TaxID=549386 RepID=A0A1G5DW65_9HYPH|nr:Malate/lactate/ureidoglycolate dehydrogenase, LDH2 family [Microvirga guangxiensis]
MSQASSIAVEGLKFPADLLQERVLAALREAGADEASAAAAARAMMHASRLGIDSHGVRLTPFYAECLRSGQINGSPAFTIKRTAAGTSMLDADHGLGHAAAYAGMEEACRIAKESGVGAVGITHSTHYGAAGAYALAGAEAGFIALSTTNADSLVAFHGGKTRFHGTNPIAAAAPVRGSRPWLLDMATSAIPYNRILLFRSLERELPDQVTADIHGEPTRNPHLAEILTPLGGADFGFKGAGLAGLVTILSAVLTGATPDHLVVPMGDGHTERHDIGHFCLAIDPERFVGRETYDLLMQQYLAGLRGSPAKAGAQVLAPGDREWQTMEKRDRTGIPVDPDTVRFLDLA